MVILGESPLSDNLTPEMNSPSAQFLSESVILHPSFNVNDFLDVPDELELELALELVPSKLEQKARMLTFLKVLTELDCELALASSACELLPLGPLLWFELEFFADDEEDWLEDSDTSLKMTPDNAVPFGHKLSPLLGFDSANHELAANRWHRQTQSKANCHFIITKRLQITRFVR